MSKTVKFTYNFKTLTAVLFAALLANSAEGEEAQAAIAAQFDAIPDGETLDPVSGAKTPKYKYKRKSVTVDLTLPEELETVTALNPARAGLIENTITRLVADFVKSEYIDNFAAVGAHDLDTILAVQAASGSRSGVSFVFSDETLGNAVTSLQKYLEAVLDNKGAANAVATAAKARFARSAITRSIGSYSEDILNKLQGRIDGWGAWIDQNDSENAEDFAVVHSAWSASIARQLKADAQVDIATII